MERVDVAIVGAGLGGLATALRLAHAGKRVVVFEKTDQVGGRNHRVQVGDCHFDGGPTLVMMLEPFRRLFADVGERLESHLQLTRCDPSYRVFYRDGSRLDATSDQARMGALIGERFGRREAEGFDRLMVDLEAMFAAAIPNFVEKNFNSPLDFFSPNQVSLAIKHGMLDNMARRVKRYFSDPKLYALFTFQSMYLGLSPFEAPWVYATLTHMEYGEGIWFPKGGVASISEAIAQLAVLRGAEIRLESPVKSVSQGRVELDSGETVLAETVVVNADLPYAERHLLAPDDVRVQRASDERTYSCSAHMVYIDYEGALPDLLHHNVFFGRDFQGNLRSILNDRALPDDPAFYACVSSRSNKALAPDGHENLYLLIPCANLERPFTESDQDALEDAVFCRLESEVGFDRNLIRGIERTTPRDWRNRFNLDRGAAFGLSHHLRQSAYFRPNNVSKRYPGVVFVGASTIPGNGMPMALISAELAAKRVLG